jgi:hypothetical protein
VAAQPLLGGLPPDLQLYAGCVIRVRLLSPTTGAAVANGRASNVSIFIRNIAGTPDVQLESGEFRLVPGPGA